MRLYFTLLFLAFTLTCHAQLEEWPKMEYLKLSEIRTASDHILVAYFLGPDLNEVDTLRSIWSLNGHSPERMDQWSTPHWSGVNFGYEHHIYLTMNEPFQEGMRYSLNTPHGDTTFVFNARDIFCESIKTNQSAYSALSNVRYAHFSIWTGTGGGQKVKGDLPEYQVFDMKSGATVIEGRLAELGESVNSGDYVYRMDLSEVVEGGPYVVEVKGYGRSHPFGVGGEFSKKLAYVSFRGLLHQRCGMEQRPPYYDHPIRDRCHQNVFINEAASRPELKSINPDTDPVIETYGGYHDAGDADRRDHHMIAPMTLLTYYDLFPHMFTDLQYNIPDQFDENGHPVGQGNGIPDIIDEAEWGTLIWELLQEESGGVRAGTEQTGYPGDEYTLDEDPGIYGTFRVEYNSSNLAAGLFAHLARAIKPYQPERAIELQERAERAWAFAGDSDSIMPGHKFYYLIQYYLLTGDEDVHNQLIQLAPQIELYVSNHQDNPRRVHDTDVLLGPHFFSYLVDSVRSKNEEVERLFKSAIERTANLRIRELEANIWPNGTSEPNRWWGSQTAQGQYADPIIMQWRLTKEQKYIDAASQLMDYNQGLNPIGKSFLTGMGFDRTEDPLHHDSYLMKLEGWGPAPGIQVFGPGNLRQLKERCPEMIPDIHSLPAQRQWMDNRRNVSGNEFTVPESITFPAVIYTILSGGDAWNRGNEPFEHDLD